MNILNKKKVDKEVSKLKSDFFRIKERLDDFKEWSQSVPKSFESEEKERVFFRDSCNKMSCAYFGLNGSTEGYVSQIEKIQNLLKEEYKRFVDVCKEVNGEPELTCTESGIDQKLEFYKNKLNIMEDKFHGRSPEFMDKFSCAFDKLKKSNYQKGLRSSEEALEMYQAKIAGLKNLAKEVVEFEEARLAKKNKAKEKEEEME